MSELAQICRLAREVRERDAPLYLAQVMSVYGSAYRRPGARLLFTTGEILAGSISGGCLEADALRIGPWYASRGPKLRRYERTLDDDEALGAGCEGTIDVLFEHDLGRGLADPLTFIEQCLAAERRGVICTVFRSALSSAPVGSRACWSLGQATESTIRNPAVEGVLARLAEERLFGGSTRASCVMIGESVEALIEVVEPPPHLFVFGTGTDVLPVLGLANSLGWNTTVCASGSRPQISERFARVAPILIDEPNACVEALDRCLYPLALIMAHDFKTDTAALAALMHSRAEYIGVLGPTARLERMLDELGPLPPFNRSAFVHGPAGLDLGGETPAEIALSIVAEAQAALKHRSACRLRERRAAIHDDAVPSSGVRSSPVRVSEAVRRGA